MPVIPQSLAWQSEAACLDQDPDIFFPEQGGSSKAARAICADCKVKRECLAYALANNEQFGIWGETSERQRRKLRKVTPIVRATWSKCHHPRTPENTYSSPRNQPACLECKRRRDAEYHRRTA